LGNQIKAPKSKVEAVWQLGTTSDIAVKFNSVALDSAGNVYGIDPTHNWVEKFDGSGKFLAKWGDWGDGTGQFLKSILIGVDNAGHVFVTDNANNRIQKFTTHFE
jgi:hypothetical protein